MAVGDSTSQQAVKHQPTNSQPAVNHQSTSSQPPVTHQSTSSQPPSIFSQPPVHQQSTTSQPPAHSRHSASCFSSSELCASRLFFFLPSRRLSGKLSGSSQAMMRVKVMSFCHLCMGHNVHARQAHSSELRQTRAENQASKANRLSAH